MSDLYPPITPYHFQFLKVSELHTIYLEECGNPKGRPILFVHGGPGGGCGADHRRFFNPEKWRIILFDQRGCGKSSPFAELKENSTWDLVSDMEKIREHLKIDCWTIFGGSWGSTLSLAYSLKHPRRVSALILRGIFLLRKWEIDWFYQEGTSRIFPDLWQNYLNEIPPEERKDMVKAYYQRLTSTNPTVRRSAAKAWSTWEGGTSKLVIDQNLQEGFGEEKFADAFARIECHYFINKGFFSEDNYLINHIEQIKNIPGIIVQGRYDLVCPIQSAYELHSAWPKSEFIICPQSGHSAMEKEIRSQLVSATDRVAEWN